MDVMRDGVGEEKKPRRGFWKRKRERAPLNHP
jgi:hypothetical protein